MELVDLPPDPERIMSGLRDTGYDFNTAIADIVDNSLAAAAKKVTISVQMDLGGEILVWVGDDGAGMDGDALKNAMKYGSRRAAAKLSLGKYGLGLKTASTAFCRRLTVVSRSSGQGTANSATWDLDFVAKENKWALQMGSPAGSHLQLLDKGAPGTSGTVVVWEKVDRLMRPFADPKGAPARKAFTKIVEGLREHLAMVFERFLATSASEAGSCQILLNDVPVTPWDPFCKTFSDLAGEETVPAVVNDTTESSFTTRAYVLPRKEDFPNQAAAVAAKLSNDRQGIYIYRENRLIHEADWLGLYTKEPHFSGCRVELCFGADLDNMLHLDIKKSQIQLPDELLTWLKEDFLPAPRREAQARYRKGQRRQVAGVADSMHASSNQGIADTEPSLDLPVVTAVPGRGDVVDVANNTGTVRLSLPVARPARPDECYVVPVDEIQDGLLWRPALIGGKKAVQINTGHEYYMKVYVPNKNDSVIVQGMDSLLWALAVAELTTVSEATKTHFAELRFYVSRFLRQLVAELPEPELDE